MNTATGRTCTRCGAPTNEHTPGCGTCYARHRARAQHNGLGIHPASDPGHPICPQCWRTAGQNLPASSIQTNTYRQPVEVVNQWNPIFSLCTVCVSVREGTVPLDSPRVYLPVNPMSRRSSKDRIYPSRANPLLFAGATCTVCAGAISQDARQAGQRLCGAHYRAYRRRTRAVTKQQAQTRTEPNSTAYTAPTVDPGLAAFLAARRSRKTRRGSLTHPASRTPDAQVSTRRQGQTPQNSRVQRAAFSRPLPR